MNVGRTSHGSLRKVCRQTSIGCNGRWLRQLTTMMAGDATANDYSARDLRSNGGRGVTMVVGTALRQWLT
jgi:hypothetical protein